MNDPAPPSSTKPAKLPEHVVQFKQEWANHLQSARALHDRDASGWRIANMLSDVRDDIVIRIFQTGLEQTSTEELAANTTVVVHGGCGRREVSPWSDIDLMLLCQNPADSAVEQLAKFVSQTIHDCGFRLGFSVQTARDACSLAMQEPTTLSSLIDSRLLAGNAELYDSYFSRFRRLVQRRVATLIQGILNKREEERREFGDTVYLLRPDVKRSRGGLRDIHLIRWIGFLKHGETELEQLSQLRALSTWDTSKLLGAGQFLLRCRHELHFHATQLNDRLTKAEQMRIAEKFGYVGSDGLFPVEKLMRDYFYHTSEVRYSSDQFVSASLYRGVSRFAPLVTRTIDGRFRLGLFQIGVKPNQLAKVSSDLEQVLRLMQLAAIHNKEIELPTWQAIRQSMTDSTDIEFTPNSAARFMALLSGASRLGAMLRRLHEMRALEKILPDFRHARSLLQFNEYHQYTVDEHSIRAVECAMDFANLPGALGQAYREIRQKDLLHLALLLHDLGKGYPEDHSEVGRRIAMETVKRLGLPKDDGDVVIFLVHKHLMMDHLATRRDISDESIVAEFAASVGSVDVLRMLYVLTCADISAVGPNVLTDWKLGLLTDLYRNAQSFLTGHTGPRAVDERLGQFFVQLKKEVSDTEDADWVAQHARALPWNYCTEHKPDVIATQLLMTRRLEPDSVECWIDYSEQRNIVELCIAKHRRPLAGIFYQITGMLASLGLRIRGANIKPLDERFVWYWYQFEDPQFTGKPSEARMTQILDMTKAVVGGLRDDPPRFPKIWDFADEPSGEVAPEIRVQIDNNTVDYATILDVFAYQKLGLLYIISKKIFEFGLDVQFARTSVYGQRIVCVFYVTDESNTKVRDLRRLVRIRRGLLTETKTFLQGKTGAPSS